MLFIKDDLGEWVPEEISLTPYIIVIISFIKFFLWTSCQIQTA